MHSLLDMTFHPNKSGIDKLFAEIAAKIERVDHEIREAYTGKDIDEIAAAAGAAFSGTGINFTGVQLRDYAAAVRDNEPFQIKVQ